MLPFDYRPNPIQRGVQRLTSTAVLARVFSKFLHNVDRPLLAWSRGRWSLTRLLAGVPMILLTTHGARSGQARTQPLVGLPVEGKIILIATNWGQARHPAWYHNLKAHPQARVTLGGETFDVTARQTEGDERQRYWEMAVRVYPGYALYVERTGGRKIPVMALEKY